MLRPSQKCPRASARMLATCSGAKRGASSITTRPPGRSMYSRFSGSGVRQSEGADASSSCCGDRGGASSAARAADDATNRDRARGRVRARRIGGSGVDVCRRFQGRHDYWHVRYIEVGNRVQAMTQAPDPIEPPLRKFQKELSAGTVSLALLGVLAGTDEPMYGYQIAKRLEQVGDGVLAGKQSALYPVLRNLEAAGVLESFVEPSDAGPPRRYYRITALGRNVLRAWSGAWRATRDSVDSVLQGDIP